ncbi:MAG: LapA family protein [Gammaproteobacteria bacterium]|nr:LapA family protein [Gammaproteobacteria bacterium]
MNAKLIIALCLVLLIILFTIQNAEVVTVQFLFWKLSVSQVLMIFFVFAIGIVVGWISHVWSRHRKLKR